jgi:hypothetical protein
MSMYPFILTYDPNPSSRYPTGYWYCCIEPGYDGDGLTPEAAMADCLAQVSRMLSRKAEQVKEPELLPDPIRDNPQA